MYDGYLFCNKGERIYNPYSVVNAFNENKNRNYWFKTGTPSFLVSLLKRQPMNLSDFNDLYATEEDLTGVTDFKGGLVPLLFQSGYLTIKSYDPNSEFYQLSFPNEEVSEGFWKMSSAPDASPDFKSDASYRVGLRTRIWLLPVYSESNELPASLPSPPRIK